MSVTCWLDSVCIAVFNLILLFLLILFFAFLFAGDTFFLLASLFDGPVRCKSLCGDPATVCACRLRVCVCDRRGWLHLNVLKRLYFVLCTTLKNTHSKLLQVLNALQVPFFTLSSQFKIKHIHSLTCAAPGVGVSCRLPEFCLSFQIHLNLTPLCFNIDLLYNISFDRTKNNVFFVFFRNCYSVKLHSI